MDEKEVCRWVEARLLELLGFSHKQVAQYIVDFASKHRNVDQVLEELRSTEVSDSPHLRAFCAELIAKLPRKTSTGTSRKRQAEQRQPSNAELLRRSAMYEPVEMDDAQRGEPSAPPPTKRAKSEKKSHKHSHSRRKKEDESDEDDTVVVIKGRKGDKKQDQAEEEDEHERDLRERDELVERMRERDEANTRKLAPGITPEQVEQLTATGQIDTKNPDAMARQRVISRRAYLEKREEKELTLLEIGLRDEHDLFSDVNLTEQERKEMQIKQTILERARDKYRFGYKDDGYRMPESYEDEKGRIDKQKREAVLTARYEEEEQVKTEQEIWEETQEQFSRVRFGAKDKKSKKNKGTEADEKTYDFEFEDHIDFVLDKARQLQEEKKEDEGDEPPIMDPKNQHDPSKLSILEQRRRLPVFSYRDQFLAAVQDHPVIVVVGETGSGKTTQIPQYLHEAGWSKLGKIGCTQPRRVAAMSVAARVASEMGVKLGHEVGYSIRFEDCTSPTTLIKYMTDGMLLREFLNEPDLASYSVMMIDEAHERTLHTDVLFGLVKDISRFRGDNFRLIISSATLDAEKFCQYFDDASLFMIPGRMFPVEKFYTRAPEADYLDAVVVTCLQIHVTQPLPGDILVFLTGQEEIETATELLQKRTQGLGSRIKELIICPIYSTLPTEQQAKIFEPALEGARKVVLGTNIAETSLTINGICYVVDTGFCKQKSYNPRTGMESLIVTPISRAAAEQRAGRAGRTQPGKCFRLYTKWSFYKELEENSVPEIQRTNMGNVVLMLKSLGIHDLRSFDFMDHPPVEALIKALEALYALGALNDRGELTKLGRRMAEFPLDPMMSKAVIASEKYKCVNEVLTIVSMLSVNNTIFYRPKEKAVHADNAKLNFARGGGGDHACLMRCYNEWVESGHSTQWCYENYVQVRSMSRARDVREQLLGLCERVEVEITEGEGELDSIRKALASGYFFNTAKLSSSGDYKTTKHAHTVYVHPSSVLAREETPAPWLLYHELAFTSKEYMRSVIDIQGQWLLEIAPHYYKEKEIQDSTTKKMPKKAGAAVMRDQP